MNINENIKQTIKKLFAALFHRTKIIFLYSKFALHNKAIILVYHRIVDGSNELSDYSSYGITVKNSDFEKQIKYLSENYNIIRLSEFIDIVSSKQPIPDRSCIVTFDDGWRDNFTTAYPILKKYNVPATIFLATNFINKEEWFWEERVKYLLAHYHDCLGNNNIVPAQLDDFKTRLRENNIISFTEAKITELGSYLTKLVNEVRGYTYTEREKFMSSLEAMAEIPGFHEPRRFMSWDEIRQMDGNIINIGGHTKSHQPLTGTSKETIGAELTESKSIIESMIGQNIDAFAYPYGKFDNKTPQYVQESGYKCACTLSRGFNDSKSDLFRLKRVDIYQDVCPTIAFFECRILGFLNMY